MNFRHKTKVDEIKKITEIREKGSVIVFPSFIWHRVTPVTAGTRYSLVNWNLGFPFR
jgi:PKHD-type hydroxylase